MEIDGKVGNVNLSEVLDIGVDFFEGEFGDNCIDN